MPRIIVIASLLLASAATGADLVPFVIPGKVSDQSLIAIASEPIAGEPQRLCVRDGHFANADGRIRIWGVNTCFGANFPSHGEADEIARRLAAFGVNCVRFHHMDSTCFPRGIWDPKDNFKLSAEALDRLDYFIARLASHGVYANINLHVSRSHARALKLPDADKVPSMDKVVGIFTPELIEAQKKYARDLLGHVNPHRKLSYAQDPAVAFVEITNEDSFFMWDGMDSLRNLPAYYAKILQDKYATWLKAKYQTTEKLTIAWAKGANSLGQSIIADPSLRLPKPAGDKTPLWLLEQHPGCAATMKPLEKSGLRIEISQADQTDWHLQLKFQPLAVKAGKYYTLSFRARADKPRWIGHSLNQAHDPWNTLGLAQRARLSNQWKTFRAGFVATANDDNARLSFSLGGDKTAVEIDEVSLAPGGLEGLRKDESLEGSDIALFAETETPARIADRLSFLAETEKAYFDGMRKFIKDELSCKALVTGTIAFGPLGLYAQSGMDYIDGHAYWHHPSFPRRQWDPGDWTVQQEAMADHPEQATLFRLGCKRLNGKPYTVSEYNHPAPNDYQAECVPMIASFAAAQDWDGVWIFAYSHAADVWNAQSFASFFDILGNPAKWGFMPAGAGIFRDGGLAPVPLGRTFPLTDLARLQQMHKSNMQAVCAESGNWTWRELLTTRAYCCLDKPAPVTPTMPPGKGELAWSVGDDKLGAYAALGRSGAVWVGHPQATPPKNLPAQFPIRVDGPAFATVTISTLDKLSLDKSRKVLVTACAKCENSGMQFTADRRSVGRNWGKGPVMIEPVSASITLPAGNWTCQALGADGLAVSVIPIEKNDDGKPIVKLSPKYKTMWYLLTRQ